MGQTVFDWSNSRTSGTPIPDVNAKQPQGARLDAYGPGFGSQVINFTTTAQEADLAKNSVYRFLSTHDGYLSLLSLADETIDGYGEDIVSDATGYKFLANTEFFLTTQKSRHLLSIKAPDAEDNGQLREMRVVRMDTRSGR